MYRLFSRLLVHLSLLTAPLAPIAPQSPAPSPPRLQLVPTLGYFTFGTYFTGPGGIEFSNQNGLAYGGQLAITLGRHWSLVGSVMRGNSDWSFESVPLVGSISVGGASLLLYDAGVRFSHPLGGASAISAVGQLTAGAIRYSVAHPLLTGAATNFALSAGAGVTGRLTGRLSLQALVKDYVASFRSVDDAASLGVEGQRAHTLGILVGLSMGL